MDEPRFRYLCSYRASFTEPQQMIGKAHFGRRMIAAQGSDPDAPLPVASHTEDVVAERDGVLTRLDALDVGVASWRLGAGRARKEDPVQLTAGIEIHVEPGERVRAGQRLLTLHTDTPERFERARESLDGGIDIDPDAAVGTGARTSVVLDRIE